MKVQEKFKNLDKEKKLEILEAAREKKRRLLAKRPRFKPHEKQLAVFKAIEAVDNVYLFSGNGFGKSASGCNQAIWWCKGYNPVLQVYYDVPETVHIILDHPDKVAETWLPELRKWVTITEDMEKKNGKPYVNEIQFKNGSRLKFMFHDQPKLVWESTQFSKIIFDEPPPRYIVIGIRRGMREKGKIPKPWKKGLLKNTEIFTGSTEDNRQNLREGYIEEFSQYLTEDERKTRLEGNFFNAGALPLASLFETTTHIITNSQFENLFNKSSDPCVIAIDPHSSKPNVAVLLGCDREGNLYYISEICRKVVPRKFVPYLKEWLREYNVKDIVWDSSGEAEGTGAEGYLTFGEVMLQDKSDDRFIERIQEALMIPEKPNQFGMRTPKLRILQGNKGIVDDIENVQWKLDKNTKQALPKLEISSTDHLAALKYALACNLTPLKGRERIVRRARNTAMYGMNRKRRF